MSSVWQSEIIFKLFWYFTKNLPKELSDPIGNNIFIKQYFKIFPMRIYLEKLYLKWNFKINQNLLLKFDIYVLWLEFMDSAQSKHYLENFQLL